MKSHSVLGFLAIFSLTTSLIAQSVPCCLPVQSFQGGQPCSGSQTTICEEAPLLATVGNKVGPLRFAECSTFHIGTSGASFVQDDCAFGGDPNWTYVGNMGNGVCCYIDTLLVPTPTLTYRDFKIRSCDVDCDKVIK